MSRERFIPVDQLCDFPGRGEFVLSFVEIGRDRVVVRMRLISGDLSDFGSPEIELRDDVGTNYEWTSSASGGLIVDEVLHAFTGSVPMRATTLELCDGREERSRQSRCEMCGAIDVVVDE